MFRSPWTPEKPRAGCILLLPYSGHEDRITVRLKSVPYLRARKTNNIELS